MSCFSLSSSPACERLQKSITRDHSDRQVLNDSSLWTVTLGIMQFQGEHATDWASVMAYVSLMMIPALVFYLFAERHLIAGLTAGAVKG